MKNLTNRILLVVVIAVGVVAAQAQSNVMLKGNVPFAFNVGDKQLPAGEYKIQEQAREVECWINAQGKGLFFLQTIPMGKEASIDTTKLVFHRYGDEYYLTEVWNSGQSHAVQSSKRERQLAKTGKYETIALLMEPVR